MYNKLDNLEVAHQLLHLGKRSRAKFEQENTNANVSNLLNEDKTLISAVNQYHGFLLRRGFKAHQLMQIIKADESMKSLEMLFDFVDELRLLGYDFDDMVAIAAHAGGDENLEAVVELDKCYLSSQYSRADVVATAGQVGGANRLRQLFNYKAKQDRSPKRALKKKFLEGDALDQCLQQNKGLRKRYAIEFILLLEKAYNPYDAQALILQRGGEGAVTALLQYHDVLIQTDTKKGFTHSQLVSIAKNHGGRISLKAVVSNLQNLLNLKYSYKDIAKIGSYRGSTEIIQSILDNTPILLASGFLPEDIIKIASRSQGHKYLDFLCDNLENLPKLGKKKDEIVAILAHPKGIERLKNLLLLLPQKPLLSGYSLHGLLQSKLKLIEPIDNTVNASFR